MQRLTDGTGPSWAALWAHIAANLIVWMGVAAAVIIALFLLWFVFLAALVIIPIGAAALWLYIRFKGYTFDRRTFRWTRRTEIYETTPEAAEPARPVIDVEEVK